MTKYDVEVRECFGETYAYKEYEQKTADYTEDKWQAVNDGLNAVLPNLPSVCVADLRQIVTTRKH